MAPSVEKVTQMFIRNHAMIEDWAVAFTDRIVFVSEVVFAFLKSIRKVWKATFSFLIDVSVIMFQDFIERMKVFGAAAAESFSLAFGDTIIKWADEWLAAGFWKRLTDPVGSAMYALFGGMADSMRKYSEETKESAVDRGNEMVRMNKNTLRM